VNTVQTTESESIQQRLQEIFARYHGQASDLIPVLQEVQEALGYLPREAMAETAEFLNIPASAVYGVVTFYAQFYLTRQGRHKIRICQGTACHVRGVGKIVQAVENKLGIKPGESTADFEFALETVACFGSCALAPVMVVDDNVYGNMTPEKALEILESIS